VLSLRTPAQGTLPAHAATTTGFSVTVDRTNGTDGELVASFSFSNGCGSITVTAVTGTLPITFPDHDDTSQTVVFKADSEPSAQCTFEATVSGSAPITMQITVSAGGSAAVSQDGAEAGSLTHLSMFRVNGADPGKTGSEISITRSNGKDGGMSVVAEVLSTTCSSATLTFNGAPAQSVTPTWPSGTDGLQSVYLNSPSAVACTISLKFTESINGVSGATYELVDLALVDDYCASAGSFSFGSFSPPLAPIFSSLQSNNDTSHIQGHTVYEGGATLFLAQPHQLCIS
jgi:hypothetical protein